MSYPQGTEAAIEGIVTAVQPSSFNFLAPSMNKVFTCYHNLYLPLKEGDAISTEATIDYQGDSMIFRLSRIPIVSIPDKPEVLVEEIMEGARYKTKRLNVDTAWQLYDRFILFAEPGETPTQTINRMTYHCRRYGTDKMDGIIKSWQLAKLMNHWHKTRILRPLYLLGLSNKDLAPCRDFLPQLHDRLTNNPYAVPHISLDKCDQIADIYGLGRGERKYGEVLRFIYGKMSKGWTSTPSSILLKEYPDLPKLMARLKEVYGVVANLRTLYVKEAYEAETYMVDLVRKERVHQSVTITSNRLVDEQIEALNMAVSSDLSIITGGPGTGKTTLLKELVTYHRDKGNKLELLSFTGKAVTRIREVTGANASTIHQLINNGDPNKKIDHMVIDETSMVSLGLLHQVLTRFKVPRLTLIGDVDQLETIEWGDMFGPLIQCGKVPVARLTINHRSDTNLVSNLSLFSSSNESEDLEEELQEYDNFVMLQGEIAMVESLLQLFKSTNIVPRNFKIITPYNKDVDKINQLAQDIFNPGTGKFRINDLVAMTDNRYDIDTMNGQEGIVTGVGDKGIEVKFRNTYSFPFSAPEDSLSTSLLTLSYAITVHRSQGSEYDIVVFYVPPDASEYFITRNLVYTALSRAKRQVYYVGDSRCKTRGLRTAPSYRCNNLLKRLS